MNQIDNCLIIDGKTWRTPLTKLRSRVVGGARIRHVSYAPGHYRMEGIGGHELYELTYQATVTELQRLNGKSWNTWMTDDPLHWHAMGERVRELPPGYVLCAGLGLGLMLHWLEKRKDITHITVVEIDPDVIELIKSTLPEDKRVSIICDDYYDFIAKLASHPAATKPDSVLWDLAVGEQHQTKPELIRGAALTAVHLPGVPLFQFGLRNGARSVLDVNRS